MRFSFCSLLLLTVASAFAQQDACQVDLPVGIIGTDGSLLDGFTARDVTVRWGKQTVAVETVDYDKGPRRVLFLLDTSRQLPPGARKAETILVDYILSRAREGDSFALLTTRGALRQVRFEEGRDALGRVVQELATDPKEPRKAASVLDSLMEGISWFGTPRTGDAVILMADHLEEPQHTSKIQGGIATDVVPSLDFSRVKFKTVATAVAEHRIRVFGLQFGGLTLDASTYEPTDENLLGLALGSGGNMVLDAADPHGSYVLTDIRVRDLQHKMFQVYGAIAQVYILHMRAAASQRRELWNLELAKDLRKNTRALYSHLLNPCLPVESARAH